MFYYFKKGKRINSFPLFLLGIFLPVIILIGCSDALPSFESEKLDDHEGLIIRIPNVEGAAHWGATRSDKYCNTRAGEEAVEGTINNLWFCAFPIDGSSGENRVVNLTQNEQVNIGNGTDDNDYTKYTVEKLKGGDYHIYLLANLEDYLDIDLNKFLSEEQVQNLILHFSTEKYLTKNNLPMAAWYKDIKNADKTPVYTEGSSDEKNGVFSFSASNNSLYADMTFLCSKVRYTILFNSENDGVSKDFGDDYVDFDIPGTHYASNLREFTPVDDNSELASKESGYIQLNNVLYSLPLSLDKYEYPANGDLYPQYDSTTDKVDDSLTQKHMGNNSKIAWQGIVYVPENLASTEKDQTKLTFNGKIVYSNSNTVNETALSDKSMYVRGKEENKLGNKRGYFYDMKALVEIYTAEPTLKFETYVHNWSLEQLSHSLHGPYDLTVDQTSVKVVAGETTYLHYETESGSKVWGESPKYNNENFYNILVKDDATIEVSVNENIPWDLPESELGNYKYFHICVGNLKKKIEVTPLEFKPFLNVSPNLITMSIQENIASGIYSGNIPITFETNVTGLEFSVNGTNHTSEKYVFGLDGSIEILKLTGNPSNQKSGTIYLDFSGLNKGYSYWKSGHSYTLTFSVSYQDSDKIIQTLEKVVEIKVQPYTTDYIIHFRSIDNSWNNPHIYVYQPLELPIDLNSNDGRAGKTVGYKLDDNGDIYASNEYIFTMGIAFKGWYGYGGPEINNPLDDGYISGDYFIFNDKKNGRTYYNDNTTENRVDSDKRFFREVHTNFNHEAKGGNTCGYCTALNLKPGIYMQKEEIDGITWWTYTLTGVATPGKARILFSQGHGPHPDSKEDKYPWTKHYPDDENSGIPLFDFPDNEGWFVYDESRENDLQFVDDQPYFDPSTQPEDPNTFKVGEYLHIFWLKNQYGGDIKYLYLEYEDGTPALGEYPGKEITYTEGNLYVYDFEITKPNQKVIKCQVTNYGDPRIESGLRPITYGTLNSWVKSENGKTYYDYSATW